jgi:8-oxo-dGTP pyrophosphatase MutT (NUDIX family)
MGVGKNTSKAICATVLLRRPNGTILMQRRDDGRGTSIPYPNMWNFPGGAAEPDEEPLDAAVREITEEFEIKLEPSDLREIWRYTHAHAAIDHIFLCPVSANTVPIMHEGAAWAWMTLSEIAQLRLGFEQMKIVEFMLRIWGDAASQ